jgi:hypothetical protein
MGNDRKVPKSLFRPAFSSVSVVVLIITTVFSTIESVESTNRAFLEVFILRPTIQNAIILAHVDFFLPPNATDKLSILPDKQSQGLRCLRVTCP